MTVQSAVRYSQGTKDIGDARNFAWEYPVPDTPFWRDLPYTLCANFLKNFTKEQLAQFSAAHFDNAPEDLEKAAKLTLLGKLLRAELEEQDATAYAKSDGKQTLFDADYPKWCSLWMGIGGVQLEMGNRAETEIVVRMLYQTRREPENLMHLHALAGLVLKGGEYAEAERMAATVKSWLDGKAGRDSPQACAARRMLAEALWKQGKKEDAEVVFIELKGIIEGEMDGGKYAVYKDGEIKMTDELTRALNEESK